MGKINTYSREADFFIKEYGGWIILILVIVALYFIIRAVVGKSPIMP